MYFQNITKLGANRLLQKDNHSKTLLFKEKKKKLEQVPWGAQIPLPSAMT